MTGELWMCLVLAVLLVILVTQNMGLHDRLGRLEGRLEWMAMGMQSDGDATDRTEESPPGP
jgi:hypothetical protein